MTPLLLTLLLPIAVPDEPASHTILLALDVLVEGGQPGELRADATELQIEGLVAAGVEVERLSGPEGPVPPARTGARGAFAYHDAQGVADTLLSLAEAHPNWCRRVEVGTSVEGLSIVGLVLSDNPGRREPDEPTLRLLGGHHGDEWSSVEVTLEAAATLLADAEDGVLESLALLSRNEVLVVPLVNPDGHAAFTRLNATEVDLNRNYGFQWQAGAANGAAPFSEPESAAIASLGQARAVAVSLSIHSGATNLGWPWNWTLDPTPDDVGLAAAAAAYASACPQEGFWITQGSDWYLSRGDTNDWSYGERGGYDLTLEVSLVKAPPPDEMPEVLAAHVPAVVSFLTRGARASMRGRVTDPDGQGVEARFTVLETGSHSWSDPDTGAYLRPLQAGVWTVQIDAPGLLSETIVVERGSDEEGPIERDLTLLSAAPTPTVRLDGGDDGSSTLRLEGVLPEDGQVQLTRGRRAPIPLPTVAWQGGLLATLDPAALGEPWEREGEWTILVVDGDGAVVWRRAGAVLLPSPSLSFGLSAIDTTPGAGDPTLILLGWDLPAGADWSLLAKDGRRILPHAPSLPDMPGRVERSWPLVGQPPGIFELRMHGGGAWIRRPGLRWDGGQIREDLLQRVSEGGDGTELRPMAWSGVAPRLVVEEAPADAAGCGCQVGGGGSAGGLAALGLLGWWRRVRPGRVCGADPPWRGCTRSPTEGCRAAHS